MRCKVHHPYGQWYCKSYVWGQMGSSWGIHFVRYVITMLFCAPETSNKKDFKNHISEHTEDAPKNVYTF